MRRARGWFTRLIAPLRPGRADADLDAELQSHLELHIADNIRAGMTPDAARRSAWIALGGMERTKDEIRDQRGFPVLDSLVRDVRHAVRLLLKSPGFTLTAIVILGLGIGANAAIFSIVNGVVLRPLPFPDSSRIVRVWHTPPHEQFPGTTIFSVSPANYIDWHAQNTSFERMSVYGFRPANLSGRGEPDALRGAAVSGEFFEVLRAQALLGRTLLPGDNDPARSHVLVLAERVWKSRFGGDPGVIGTSIQMNGEPYTVVGVMPQQLKFPGWADVWMPLVWDAKQQAVRGNHNYLVIARLRSDADVRRAQTEMTTISQRLEQQYPADNKGWGALVVPLHQDMISDVRWGLLVLLGAVACVLLIACANLANLMLARVLGRAREIAIRTAVGASRWRIVQQVLVECTVLSVAGGAVGLLAASWSVGLIVKSFGTTLPRAGEIALDGRVLAFTSVVAILTGVVAAVAPAWRMTRGDTNEALKQGMGRGGTHAGERRVRTLLVTAEIALALVLLVGAGLLIRTLSQLRAVDPGIDPRNVMTATVQIPTTKYKTREQMARFFDETLQRLRALPGVQAAAAIDALPLQDGGSMQPVAIEGEPARPMSAQPEVAVRLITTGYLQAIGMRVMDGRDFTQADRPDRPLAVLISASAARRFWPDGSAIGKRLTLGLISNDAREVVGVVSDVKVHGLNVADAQVIYVPSSQSPSPHLALVVRAAMPPQTIVPSIVGAVHAVDAEQPVIEVQTMDEVIGDSIAQQRFAMRLLTGFAALALLLAAVGIYGVLSYTVRQRVQEIGIRMALGAARVDVVRMVLVEGLKPTFAGMIIGVAGAAAVARVLTSLVFGISPRDAATFAAVSAVVLAVGLLSSLLPAYRATQVDPLEALRAE
jgi:putative ABC transport system permease protein